MTRLHRSSFLLCVALAAPAHAHAQRTYDLATGVGGERLIAGRDVTVDVTGLDPVCYTPGIKLDLVESRADVSSVIGTFSPGATTPPKDTPISVPATQPTGAGAAPLSLIQPDGRAVSDKASRALSTRDRFAELLNQASRLLTASEAARRRAVYYTATLDSPPCQSGPGWFAPFAAQWSAERENLTDQLNESLDRWLPDAAQALAQAAGLAKPARLAADAVDAASERKALQDLSEADQKRLTELNAAHAQLRSDVPVQASNLTAFGARMEGLAPRSSLRAAADAGFGVEAANLTITLAPAAANAAKLPDVVYRFPVHRPRFRLFASTGAFTPLARTRSNFQRVNRQSFRVVVTRDSLTNAVTTDTVPLDSIYSTYGRRSQGALDVVSPTLQANLTLHDIGAGFPLLASVGAAARTVNGQVLPEPFFGLGLGLNDRFVFSAGLHLGRSEKLLLMREGETEKDVLRRPIPSAVKDEDAIGVTWESAGFISISIKP
jgi:hypothetical protein